MSYTAVVLAGQRPGTDPLAAHFGEDMKALIPVAGEAMVRHPVRALLASPEISKVIVMAQRPERLGDALADLAGVEIRQSRPAIAETMLALCDDPVTAWPVLVTTADHALLTPAMIADLCAQAVGRDVTIGMVEKSRLMRRLPNTRRTWYNFRGESLTGANLFALSSARVAPAIRLWRSVEQDRKKAWRVIALLGPVVLAMAALRLTSAAQVAARLSLKLGLRVDVARLDDPLAGVDVDKRADHELVEAILAGRT